VPLLDKRIEVIRALLGSDGPVVIALQDVTPGYVQSLASLSLKCSLAHRKTLAESIEGEGRLRRHAQDARRLGSM